jgi:hypothetical protein
LARMRAGVTVGEGRDPGVRKSLDYTETC